MEDDPLLPLPPSAAMNDVAAELARVFLTCDASPAALREAASHALGRPWPWLTTFCLRLHFAFGPVWSSVDHRHIAQALLDFPAFRAAFFVPGQAPPCIRAHRPRHAVMAAPPPPLAGVTLPALPTPGDLADWLGVSPTELAWFAHGDLWRAAASAPKHRHYHCRWLEKRSGGLRLIEAPKARLRDVQRRILHGILDPLPLHPAALGCVRGHSALEHAQRHAGRAWLLKLDVRDFFPAIHARRIEALFRTLGYPAATADCLTRLTTRCTPALVLRQAPPPEYASPEERWRRRRWLEQFRARHLPQGAPTSPALANLCAYRLDLRLAGLAAACHARYSRYVDDIAFSLDAASPAQGRRLLALIGDILWQEGFTPNWRKTRIEPASAAQRLTGLIVNRHPNLPRQEYELLRATLTNCRRHGPKSQNRQNHPHFKAHLEGRLAWLTQVNPQRGQKLRAIFAEIAWD